jgi:acyl-CoA reductase-like NAD-dependent aldehyde dehydrogenase
VAKAVAETGHSRAQADAEAAVRETGFGVVAHKRLKNELCSLGIYDTYAGQDFVGPVAEPERRLVRFARPAGVILALTPSTNPIATLNFKAVLAMLTRNAVIFSPHPLAKACSVAAAEALAEAARRAGAPDGAIQVLREPSIPLVEAAMSDPRVDLVLATGGPAVVQAAYRSGHPAYGVGPGNAPAYVHESADPAAAAQRLIESKSFDNSILCTNESVVLADRSIADRLIDALRAHGAHVCSEAEADRLRAVLWDGEGRFNVSGALGKDAAIIARAAGIVVPSSTRILLVPLARVQPEEPFAREKLAPVLGFARVDGPRDAGRAGRAMMRRSGTGHSAAFHGRDEAALMAFARSVPALRVAVNVPLSQGAAGFGTNLGPTMTIGTGFGGGSALGENLRPDHLIDWVQIAQATDATPARFDHLSPWRSEPLLPPDAPIPYSQGNPPGGPVGGKRAPVPGVDLPFGGAEPGRAPARDDLAALRAEIRALVLEELRAALQKA